MPLPTLLVAGNLLPNKKRGDKGDLKDVVPMDYIYEFINSKMIKKSIGKGMTMDDLVLILESKTGSGKSTAFITMLYRKFYQASEGIIMVTQPRVLTAQNKAIELAEAEYNPDLIFKKNIGFSTGPLKEFPDYGILFATIGVLKARLEYNTDTEICDMYKIIVIDEAHERSNLNLIHTMYLLKEFLGRNINNPNCPYVVFTSATFDVKKYADYMGVKNSIINVLGAGGIGIESIFAKEDVVDYLEEVSNLVRKIHTENPNDTDEECDILVFLVRGGIENDIIKENLSDIKDIEILELNRKVINSNDIGKQRLDIPLSELRKIVGKPNIKRRVILSTVVAETGLTINTLKYVIDAGYNNTNIYNPLHDDVLNEIYMGPVSKDSAIQRKGRVGRIFPGKAYHLYTEKVYNKLPDFDTPAIYNSDITNMFLKLIDKNGNPPVLLDNFSTPSVHTAINRLKKVGFYRTELGEIAKDIVDEDFSIEMCKTIMCSYIWKFSIEDAIDLVLFNRMIGPRFDIIKCLDKLGYFKNISNYTLSRIFNNEFFYGLYIARLIGKSTNLSTLKKTFADLGIESKELTQILVLRKQIYDKFYVNGFKNVYPRFKLNDPKTLTNEMTASKNCIQSGYINNMAFLDTETGAYKTLNGLTCICFLKPKPRTICYRDLKVSKNKNMLIAQSVCSFDGF